MIKIIISSLSLIIIIMMIISARNPPKGLITKKYMLIIPLCVYIYEFFSNHFGDYMNNEIIGKIHSLNIYKSNEVIKKEFYVKIIALCILSVFITNIYLIIPRKSNKTNIENGYYIKRDKTDKKVSFITNIDDIKKEVSITVPRKTLNKNEIKKAFSSIFTILNNKLKGDNKDLMHVSKSLYLPTKIKDYDVDISYSFEAKGVFDEEYEDVSEIINEDGTLNNNFDEAYRDIKIIVSLSYLEETENKEYLIRVLKKNLSEREITIKNFEEELNWQLTHDTTGKYVKLPDNINKKEVTYKENTNNKMDISLLFLLIPLCFYLLYKLKINEKIKEKNKNMQLMYSDFIEKLVLLLEAGLSIRSIFVRMTDDYIKKKNKNKNYLYEEMLLTRHEMENGIEEIRAYTNFGKRIGLQEYQKVSTLLIQSVKISSDSLISMLLLESENAIKERRELIKVQGEEASTRLLIPMVLLMLDVMIIIMFAAFMSIS